MKKAFVMFWQGLTGILVGVAGWFTEILGMKDNSRYGAFLRRVVGTCFALVMVVVAVASVYAAYRAFERRVMKAGGDEAIDHANWVYLSRGMYYYPADDASGFVMDNDGNKTLKGVNWIAKPLGSDSLVCYSDGSKRGYFNKFTGKTVIDPRYDHAWVFSEGLAAVDDGGKIKFIDQSGKVVIDNSMTYVQGMDGYVFHNGHCAVHGKENGKMGLIDRQGKWAVKPEYVNVYPVDSLWVVDNGAQMGVLRNDMSVMIPISDGRLSFGGGAIFACQPDHTVRKYDRQGNLVDGFYVNEVEKLTFDTDELAPVSDADGQPGYVEAVAVNSRYEAEVGWYGLMSPTGKIITPPMYKEIKAIGRDLYLCDEGAGYGVVIDGDGNKVGM